MPSSPTAAAGVHASEGAVGVWRAVTDSLRRFGEMRYRLMPYVYAQAQLASRVGHPMVRPLFFEYREDPTSWLTEDQYMFGTDLLVAPLMEEGRDRGAYLSPGRWAD